MQLQYTDPQHRSIRATLDDGDMLGHHPGPAELFVPTDPANAEYADVLARGLTVEEPPPLQAEEAIK